MNNLVKNAFLVIMGVTVAMLLYLALFGTYDLNGNSLVGTTTGTITQTAEWKGALWYAAEAMENPISRYYYEYCYLPNLHKDDYVDEALGGSKSFSTLQKTATDLSSSPTDDIYNFSTGSSSVFQTYTTGWK